MIKAVATSMLWRGAIALIIGVVAIAWSDITVGALVVLFTVYAFAEAVDQFVRLFVVRGYGSMVGHLLLAVLDMATGVVALTWPGVTVFALTMWVGVWAVATGLIEVVAASVVPDGVGTRIAFVLGGVFNVLFGATMFAHRGAGAGSLSLLFGLFSLAYGANLLVTGIILRKDADLS